MTTKSTSRGGKKASTNGHLIQAEIAAKESDLVARLELRGPCSPIARTVMCPFWVCFWFVLDRFGSVLVRFG